MKLLIKDVIKINDSIKPNESIKSELNYQIIDYKVVDYFLELDGLEKDCLINILGKPYSQPNDQKDGEYIYVVSKLEFTPTEFIRFYIKNNIVINVRSYTF